MRESGVAVVIGATVLGEGIAAELANAGWSVHLLDASMEHLGRSLSRLRTARPPLLYLPEFLERIHTGTLNELTLCRTADWVIEAVPDQLEAKRRILSRVEVFVGPETLTTTTSTFHTATELAAECAPAFRERFLTAHFSVPPRYQKLVELAPGAETLPEHVTTLAAFIEDRLGHRVVVTKPSPGLVALRLWLTHHLDALQVAQEQEIDLELADALTGPLIGRSLGVLRALDHAGLDTVAALAKALALPVPTVLADRIAEGAVGERVGKGFFQRVGDTWQVLDPVTGTYRPLRETQPVRSHPYLTGILERFFTLVQALQPQLTESELALDQALEWGYGWSKGPFALEAEAHRHLFAAPSPPQEYLDLNHWPILAQGSAFVLRDLGDGLAGFSFLTPQNRLTPAVCDALVETIERAEHEFLGLILANEGPHFSPGFDRERWWRALQAQDWDTLEADIQRAQAALLRLREAQIPVVGMLRGRTLGGAAELALHCTAVHAAAETYIGLTQVHVGLLPCFGGTVALLHRLGDARQALRTILGGQVSTSAHEARQAGYLLPTDTISRNADRLLFETRQKTLSLVEGFEPRREQPVPAAGGGALRAELDALRASGRITSHERRIAEALVTVLCDGSREPRAVRAREREACLALCQEPLSQARLQHFIETGTPLRT